MRRHRRSSFFVDANAYTAACTAALLSSRRRVDACTHVQANADARTHAQADVDAHMYTHMYTDTNVHN